MNEPEVIARLLRQPGNIAVVGLSDNPAKPSYYVSEYMQSAGFRIFPVNPALTGPVLGEMPYASLADLPVRPDIVNVFRLPRFIPAVVDEVIDLKLPAIWVQQGLFHAEAGARAEAAGVATVMDRCIMVEHRYLR